MSCKTCDTFDVGLSYILQNRAIMSCKACDTVDVGLSYINYKKYYIISKQRTRTVVIAKHVFFTTCDIRIQLHGHIYTRLIGVNPQWHDGLINLMSQIAGLSDRLVCDQFLVDNNWLS